MQSTMMLTLPSFVSLSRAIADVVFTANKASAGETLRHVLQAVPGLRLLLFRWEK